MSTAENNTDNPTLVERILAYVTLSVVVLAVASYITTLIVGMNDREALAGGLWPLITLIAYVGLPIGFVSLVTLLILSMRRRGKAARAAITANARGGKGGKNKQGGKGGKSAPAGRNGNAGAKRRG